MTLDLLTPQWLTLKLPRAAGKREQWPLVCDGVLCLLGADEAQIDEVMRSWWLDGLGRLAAGEGNERAAETALGAVAVETALLGGHGGPDLSAVSEVLQASFDSRRRRANGLQMALEDGRMRSAQDEQAEHFLADLQRGERAVADGLASGVAPQEAFAAAASALHSAVKAFKHDPIAHFLLGWLELFHSADALSARATFERAVGCRRVDADFRCLILRHTACALSRLAENDASQARALREQAVDAITEALTLAPEDSVVQWETARLCVATGRVSNAKRLLTEALAADPALAIDVALDPAFAPHEDDLLEVFRNLRERSRRAAQAAIKQAETIAEGLQRLSGEATDGLPGEEDEGPGHLESLALARAMLSQGSHLSCAAAGRVAEDARGQLLDEAHSAFSQQLQTLHEEREQIQTEAAEVFEALSQLPEELLVEDPQDADGDAHPTACPARTLFRGAAGLALVAVVCLIAGGHLWALGRVLLGLSVLMCVPQVLEATDLRIRLPGARPPEGQLDPEEVLRLRLAAAEYREQLADVDGRIAEVSGVVSQLAA